MTAADRARRERAEQGRPPTIEDPVVLAEAAQILTPLPIPDLQERAA